MSLDSHKISDLEWTLTGYVPYDWQMGGAETIGMPPNVDTGPVPALVPGSVQKALLNAGKVPDWNIGMNARLLEWVENRHWLYETHLPAAWFQHDKKYIIRCEGLDNQGQIYLNGHCIYEFVNAHIEHSVEIPPDIITEENNVLQILFECPPRWLGGINYTSKIRDWKPRFYYTWDWISRVVQIGIYGDVYIEELPENQIEGMFVNTDYHIDTCKGSILLDGAIVASSECTVVANLSDQDKIIASRSISAAVFNEKGLTLEQLDIQPWWPHTLGAQMLYDLEVALIDMTGKLCDRVKKRIGFKNVQWHPCRNAPQDADPWLCCINGKELFLQGVNWTPIRPNFADLKRDDYKKRVELYKSIGMNIFRMWGGTTLENAAFYELCDELGLLVWQEFPLSGSGLENYPPDDEEMVDGYAKIVQSYLARRHHHASLLMWGGGNELTNSDAIPLGLEHPMLKMASEIVQQKDKQHRFVTTSPTGPAFCAAKENYGKGMHWDIHGPWNVLGDLDQEWKDYWANDDSLFRSELGAPGPSSADMIRRYAGDCDTMPYKKNSLWQRTGWWLEIDQYIKEMGQTPDSLEAYVEWGQNRQAAILMEAYKACRGRFPECGGYIIWMGHDSFPCTANTAIVDFEGNPKPAAKLLAKILMNS